MWLLFLTAEFSHKIHAIAYSRLAPTPANSVYSPAMSARTTSAPRARRLRAERRRVLRVRAMGGVGGAVGLRYEAFEGR